MQFKDLFRKTNISRLIMLAIIVFLFLPLIFPEKNDFKMIRKESIYSHEDSPLPIFPKDSVFDKYADRFKKFYKINTGFSRSQEDTNQTETIETDEKQHNRNIDITADDLFFLEDVDDEDIYLTSSNSQINLDSAEQKDNTVNLQKGIVLTKDGLVLEPTQEGYYYKGKFYKNGTYPQNTNRKHIEGALSRYHSRIAKNLGKKALYFVDENGGLTVSYVDSLPDQTSTSIDAYYQNNQNKNQIQNHSYQNTRDEYKGYQNISENNNDIMPSDIARVSIKDMHAAYKLFHTQIQNGQMGQGININQPFQNALVNNFLNNNNTHSVYITSNKPNEISLPPAASEGSETVIAGGQDFAQDYANKIHELNCGTEDRGNIAATPLDLPSAIDNIFKVVGGGSAVSCDTAPLIFEPSSTIAGNIQQNSDLERFTDELNKVTNRSEKTDINIISTDRNFYPVASILNKEESIRNNKDEPVTVHIIGPNENEADLSKILEGVTYSITDDLEAADKLTDDLANYYSLTQYENADTHTVLAFPTEDEKQVFILADPNNSYWLKNPRQLENMSPQYMERNGVYYKGVIVDKIQIGYLVNEEKTNLLYISDKNYTHYLPNGSVLTTVSEEDVKINSLHPEQIQKNTGLVKNLSENGQKNLEKVQQKKQQRIEIKDYEKGNRKVE